jgi:SpoVK/Ycf46/Vps4 family AAA+-type ATPase
VLLFRSFDEILLQAKMNFVSVRSTELLSKYFGQTEASIRSLFKQVRAAAPCLLFFDEFDALACKR